MFFTDAAPASHSHGYTYVDSHLDPISHSDANRNGYRHPDCPADAYSNANSYTSAHPGSGIKHLDTAAG